MGGRKAGNLNMQEFFCTTLNVAFIGSEVNERSRKVEADVAMCPLPSLFCREENRDGVACVPYYTATDLQLRLSFILVGASCIGRGTLLPEGQHFVFGRQDSRVGPKKLTTKQG